MVRRLHIPDCHWPSVDKRAYRVMLDVAQDFKPHHVLIYGDFWDFYNLSTFSKDVTRTVKLIEEEVDTGIDALHYLIDRFKNVTILLGNHEHRFTRFVSTFAPILSRELTLENVLHIPKGVEVIPYGQRNIYEMGDLVGTHGSICGRYSVFKMAQKYGNVVYGHTHQISRTILRDRRGEYEAINIGWLGDFEKADYKDINEWSHGFGISYHSKRSYGFELVHIKDYRTIVHGKEYVGASTR